MKPYRRCFLGVALSLLLVLPALAQTAPPPRSAKKAFALSLLMPGLGHRYVQYGHWKGRATAYAFAETGLWLGLAQAQWRYDQQVESYETLAAGRAAAQVEDKNRTFFLNLATYRSSDEYLELSLRNRAWDQIDYVSDVAFQWEWQSEADFQRFRELRNGAESLRQRRLTFTALLFANRLIAGISAIRAANRSGSAPGLSLAPPPEGARVPMLQVQVGL